MNGARLSLLCYCSSDRGQGGPLPTCAAPAQVVNVLGFSLPFYRSPTLLLSLGLSVRVLYYLITQRPDVIHVSSPGLLVFAATLYAKLLAIPLVVSAPLTQQRLSCSSPSHAAGFRGFALPGLQGGSSQRWCCKCLSSGGAGARQECWLRSGHPTALQRD